MDENVLLCLLFSILFERLGLIVLRTFRRFNNVSVISLEAADTPIPEVELLRPGIEPRTPCSASHSSNCSRNVPAKIDLYGVNETFESFWYKQNNEVILYQLLVNFACYYTWYKGWAQRMAMIDTSMNQSRIQNYFEIKKEEIKPSHMTHTSTLKEKPPKQSNNTKTPPKRSITQRLRTDWWQSVKACRPYFFYFDSQ